MHVELVVQAGQKAHNTGNERPHFMLTLGLLPDDSDLNIAP